MGHGLAPDASPSSGSPRGSTASGSFDGKGQSGYTVPDVHDQTLIEEVRGLIDAERTK
jgi:hypothetical protein